MDINIELIVNFILPIIGLILTYLVWPYVRLKVSEQQLNKIKDWVNYSVLAAEQMDEAGLIEIPKKDFVVKFLKEKGFNITEAELDILIEATVKALNIEQ